MAARWRISHRAESPPFRSSCRSRSARSSHRRPRRRTSSSSSSSWCQRRRTHTRGRHPRSSTRSPVRWLRAPRTPQSRLMVAPARLNAHARARTPARALTRAHPSTRPRTRRYTRAPTLSLARSVVASLALQRRRRTFRRAGSRNTTPRTKGTIARAAAHAPPLCALPTARPSVVQPRPALNCMRGYGAPSAVRARRCSRR